jgi:hypothetical protein
VYTRRVSVTAVLVPAPFSAVESHFRDCLTVAAFFRFEGVIASYREISRTKCMKIDEDESTDIHVFKQC